MADGAVRTHVVIPGGVLKEIDERVGERKRSEFITQALREKLDRLQLLEAAENAAGSLADVDIPGWESSEAAAEWVHKLRRGGEYRDYRG